MIFSNWCRLFVDKLHLNFYLLSHPLTHMSSFCDASVSLQSCLQTESALPSTRTKGSPSAWHRERRRAADSRTVASAELSNPLHNHNKHHFHTLFQMCPFSPRGLYLFVMSTASQSSFTFSKQTSQFQHKWQTECEQSCFLYLHEVFTWSLLLWWVVLVVVVSHSSYFEHISEYSETEHFKIWLNGHNSVIS